MKVKNIKNTANRTCNCTSWLEHWKNFSGQALPAYCPEKSCLNAPEVGAHVQKDNSTDQNWYIVPLCKTHNATDEAIEVGSITLVSANVSQTCGKNK